MELAKDVKKIKQNFRFNDKYLPPEDENVYADLFPVQMKKLSLDIEDSEIEYDTFYLTGQSGNGKSTFLNRLKSTNEYLKNNFKIIHLMGDDVFDYTDKITIVDVLLMIGIKLVEDDDELGKKYFLKLEEMKNLSLKKIEKSEIKTSTTEKRTNKNAGIGINIGFLDFFKIGASFKKDWNNEEQTRIEFRKLFKLDRVELLNIINDIISTNNEKKFFLILDDLEKKHISDELFTIHKDILEKIQFSKIIVIPVNYATSAKVYKLNLRVNDNPLLISDMASEPSEKDKEEIKTNKTILKNIIYKRIDKAFYHLLPDAVIEKIIEFSGCNIRQLLRLVNESASNARYLESEVINEDDVYAAIQDLLNTMTIGIHNRVSFLQYIHSNHTPPEDKMESFKQSIADNTIFAYFNGTPWYEVNPIIKKYISLAK